MIAFVPNLMPLSLSLALDILVFAARVARKRIVIKQLFDIEAFGGVLLFACDKTVKCTSPHSSSALSATRCSTSQTLQAPVTTMAGVKQIVYINKSYGELEYVTLLVAL